MFRVGAMYYPCYPEWWMPDHDPLLGKYDFLDVIGKHCGWLEGAGVGFLIIGYFWDRYQDYETKLRKLMRKVTMPYCLQLECANRSDDEVLKMLEYVETHIKNPDYYRVSGQPLIVGYEPTKPFEQMGWHNPGHLVRYMNRGSGDWQTWRLWERFDGSDPPNPWNEQVGVTPGCVPGHSPRDPELFRARLRRAMFTRPEFLTLYSWNEWPEGAQIEPSELEGDEYLRVLAEELS